MCLPVRSFPEQRHVPAVRLDMVDHHSRPAALPAADAGNAPLVFSQIARAGLFPLRIVTAIARRWARLLHLTSTLDLTLAPRTARDSPTTSAYPRRAHGHRLYPKQFISMRTHSPRSNTGWTFWIVR